MNGKIMRNSIKLGKNGRYRCAHICPRPTRTTILNAKLSTKMANRTTDVDTYFQMGYFKDIIIPDDDVCWEVRHTRRSFEAAAAILDARRNGGELSIEDAQKQHGGTYSKINKWLTFATFVDMGLLTRCEDNIGRILDGLQSLHRTNELIVYLHPDVRERLPKKAAS